MGALQVSSTPTFFTPSYRSNILREDNVTLALVPGIGAFLSLAR